MDKQNSFLQLYETQAMPTDASDYLSNLYIIHYILFFDLSDQIQSSKDRQETCAKIVTDAIEFHQHRKAETDKCSWTHHVVLYEAAFLCYKWGFANSSKVAQLLQTVCDCEGRLDSFLMHFVFFIESATLSERGVFCRFPEVKDAATASDVLDYFLRHSSQEQQTFIDFSTNDEFAPVFCPASKRLSEIVLRLFCDYCPGYNCSVGEEVVPSVLLALTYGTEGTPYYEKTCDVIIRMMLHALVTRRYVPFEHHYAIEDNERENAINFEALRVLGELDTKLSNVNTPEQENSVAPDDHMDDEVFQEPEDDDDEKYESSDDEVYQEPEDDDEAEDDDEKYEKPPYSASLLECLLHFFRAVPHVSLSFRKADCNLPENVDSGILTAELDPELISESIVPLNRYQKPAELQHLCRCAVRKRLSQNWELPQGIQKLPINDIYKNYLSLLTD